MDVHEVAKSYCDLLNGPRVAALTTIMPDGQPQTTVVWCNFDGTYVLVNTMRGFRKEKNMRSNPKITLLCYDPRHPLRYLEVRGTVVEMTEAGALEHLDRLACSPHPVTAPRQPERQLRCGAYYSGRTCDSPALPKNWDISPLAIFRNILVFARYYGTSMRLGTAFVVQPARQPATADGCA